MTVTATLVNYLADASQLKLGTRGGRAVSVHRHGHERRSDVGLSGWRGLDRGPNSTFSGGQGSTGQSAASDSLSAFAKARIEDEADMLSFRVNRSLEVVHKSLSAFYTATGGAHWTSKLTIGTSRGFRVRKSSFCVVWSLSRPRGALSRVGTSRTIISWVCSRRNSATSRSCNVLWLLAGNTL